MKILSSLLSYLFYNILGIFLILFWMVSGAEAYTDKDLQKYARVAKILKGKGKGQDLGIQGTILEVGKCYRARFSVEKPNEDFRDTQEVEFLVLDVDPQPGSPKLMNKPCSKDIVDFEFARDFGLGLTRKYRAYYCPIYVSKMEAYIREFNLAGDCWGLKTFDECYDRTSSKIKRINVGQTLNREKAASAFWEINTYINGTISKVTNHTGMLSLWELDSCPNSDWVSKSKQIIAAYPAKQKKREELLAKKRSKEEQIAAEKKKKEAQEKAKHQKEQEALKSENSLMNQLYKKLRNLF
jgi:hypothetical protein